MDNCDKVQLCAQALCLEEMMNVEIPEGALFMGRRGTGTMSSLTVHCEPLPWKLQKDCMSLLNPGITPKAEYSKKCEHCSLVDLCLPKVSSKASNYLLKVMEE